MFILKGKYLLSSIVQLVYIEILKRLPLIINRSWRLRKKMYLIGHFAEQRAIYSNIQRGKPVRKVAALTHTFLPTFVIRLKSKSWCPHFFFKPTILNIFEKPLYIINRLFVTYLFYFV